MAKLVDLAAEKGATVEEYIKKEIDFKGLQERTFQEMFAHERAGRHEKAAELESLFNKTYDL